MPGITINSGRMTFADHAENSGQEPKPFKVLVLADFGGDKKLKPLATRKPRRIDKDNFEEEFERMSVSMSLPALDADIQFLDVDDLHPDFLYDRLPLFADYRVLKRKLAKTKNYDEALELLNSSKVEVGVEVGAQSEKTESGNVFAEPAQEIKLDDLLGVSTDEMAPQQKIDDIDGLIKSIVAPYVEEKADKRIDDLVLAVDQAVNATMRSIMHSSVFQSIEASWRSLDLLNRRLDTDRSCKLSIIDVSNAELFEDLGGSESYLKKLIVDESQTKGVSPFDIVLCGFDVKPDVKDIESLKLLASACDQAGSLLLTSAGIDIAGYTNDDELEEGRPSAISDDLLKAWQEFSQSPNANNIFCVAPHFLLRLPYGKRGSQTHEFNFEELPDSQGHRFYLWGGGAYLLTLLLAQAYIGNSTNTVERLPLHVTIYDDEEQIKPSGEYLLSDRQAKPLVEMGLTVIRSVKNSDQVIIDPIQSILGS